MVIKKTLVLPPWMDTIKFYTTDIHNFHISSGIVEKSSHDDDYVIGVSLGALAILASALHIKGKIILINPLVPSRSLGVWFMQWVKYIGGGLFVERQKFTSNPLKWVTSLWRAYRFLTSDFSSVLQMFPKDRLIVIRNKEDDFFCNTEAVAYLRSFGIQVVEIEGGHNWNKNTEDEMNRQLGRDS